MTETNKWMIDPNDAVLLLIDHQSGLFQLVRDMEYSELRNNVTTLAKVAHIAKIPTITTASVPDGPNGPIIPEIHQSNPEAVHVPRSGPINAWDHRPFVEAIERTNRKTLLIAGTLTSICMAFPALKALAAGYKVFCIVDASGNHSQMATDLTIARVTQAGAMPIDHCLKQIDDEQAGDRFVLQRLGRGVAETESADDDIKFTSVERRESEPGELTFGFGKEARHQVFVA